MTNTQASKASADAIRWTPLLAAMVAIALFGFALGLNYPLLTLTLEQRGYDSTLIGLNAAMLPLGILLLAPFMVRLCARFGRRRMALAAAFTAAVLMPAYLWFPSIEAWFALRLVNGGALAVLFALSEAWMVEFAGDRHRGKLVAVYGSLLSVSFAAGPFLLGQIGIEGALPFAIGAGVALVGWSMLWLLPPDPPEADTPAATMSVPEFARRAPQLIACVGAFAILDAALLALLPVYATQHGLSVALAANMLAVLLAGNAIFQLPIGYLADRYSHRAVLIGCALLTVLAFVALPWAMTSFWKWPLVLLAGTTGYGVYIVALASLGSQFRGRDLLSGAASYAMVWGVAGLFGAMLGGVLMDVFGKHALPLGLAAVYAGLAWYLWRRGRQINN